MDKTKNYQMSWFTNLSFGIKLKKKNLEPVEWPTSL